jgi:hypothetical protein
MNCHEADIMGTVSCRARKPSSNLRASLGLIPFAVSAHAMNIVSGRFRLFVADPLRTDTNDFVYELNLASVEGKQYKLTGFKVVDNSSMLDPTRLWEQTTTLYVKLERKSTKSDTLHAVGLGMLVSAVVGYLMSLTYVSRKTMTLEDFTKEMASFKAYSAKGGSGLRAAFDFTKYFTYVVCSCITFLQLRIV